MRRGDKKGLSEVITTLIIILLSLVAIGVIWIVIGNIVNSGSDQIEIGKYTLDMEVQKILENGNSTNITIKRNQGKGELTGIKIIISDGVKTYLYDKKDISLKELEIKTYTINYTGPVKSVSISPIIKTGNTETTQNVVDTLEISGYNAAKNMPGLVSWWRMEGNANDEMGRNNGVLVGNPQLVNGKYGKAYNFTGIDYIIVNDNVSIRLQNNMSIAAWIYFSEDLEYLRGIVNKGDSSPNSQSGYYLAVQDDASGFRMASQMNGYGIPSNKFLLENNWIHLMFANNFTSLPGTTTHRLYINGTLDKQQSRTLLNGNTSGYSLTIGYETLSAVGAFYGAIDEVMIFNRTLSADEIKALYSLDLSN